MAVYEETVKLEDRVSPAALEAAKSADMLSKKILAAKAAMVQAGALGDVMKYRKAAQEAKMLVAAVDQLPQHHLFDVVAARAAIKAEQDLATATALAEKQKVAASKAEAKAVAEAASEAKKKKAEQDKADRDHAKALKEQQAAYEEAKARSDATSAGIVEALGMVGAGAAAAALAVAGLALAFGGAIYAGAKFALEASADKLATEQLFEVLSEGKNTGAEVADAIEDIARAMGVAKGMLEDFAKPLMAMGITDMPALEQALQANAAAFAIFGQKGSDAFQAIEKKIQVAIQTGGGLKIPIKGLGSLAQMGLTVADVADKMGISAKKLAAELKAGTANAEKFGNALENALIEKGAAPLQRMGIQLGTVWSRFKDDIGDMFEDIDVTPFLVQVKDMFSIFSQAKPSGQALKAGITGFFNETFKVAVPLVLVLKHFFLDLVIWSLKAYIALRPIGREIASWLKQKSTIDGIKMGLKGLAIAAGVIAAAVGLAGAAFVAIGATYAAVFGAVAANIAMTVYQVYDAVKSIFNFISGMYSTAYNIGSSIIEGLIEGIKAGYAKLSAAAAGLAGKVRDTFKSVLDSHSPSRVMFELGAFAAEGAELGIKSKTADVGSATADLANMAPGAMASSSSSTKSINVEANFNFGGGGGDKASHTDLTEQAVALLFERIALESGV